MITTASKKAMEAMRRLANTDQGFNDILTWLAIERESLVKQSTGFNEVHSRQCQGAFQLLDALFEQIEVSKR